MNVLWFTNIALPEYTRANGNFQALKSSGGWMVGLLDAVRRYAPDVRLSVAFRTSAPGFAQVEGVDYYGLGDSADGAFLERVEQCVRSARPDVIHVHGSEGIAQVLPDSLLARGKVVLSLQGIMEIWAENYFGGLTWADLKSYETIVRRLLRYPNERQIATDWQTQRAPRERELCRRILAFMGRTRFDRDWIRRVNPAAAYFHVDEILRPEFYRGRAWAAEPGRHVIYAGAAFTYPLKGGHWLLRALKIVKESYPDVELRVAASRRCALSNWKDRVSLGAYGYYLVHLIDELGLRDHVTFLPALSAQEVRNELVHANVYCLASTMENSPNSLCEAQMTGTPAVATRVGGVEDLATDGVTGYVVAPRDPGELAEAILRAFRLSPEQAEKMTEGAYEAAVRRHDPKNIVHDLLAAYRAVEGKK